MAKGHENLVPMNKRTKEEQREIAKKGGKASGEARRRKRELKELLEIALEQKTEGGDTKAECITNMLVEQAMAGNTKAYRLIRDTLGQAPVQKIQTSEVDPDIIKEVEQMIENESDTMADTQSE